jgi:hypothetical protein
MRRSANVYLCPAFLHVDGGNGVPTHLVRQPEKRKVNQYYVQQLYGHIAGTHVLKNSGNKAALSGQDGIYASSTGQKEIEIILKIANVSNEKRS